MANSDERSKLVLFDRKAATELFIRSNHNDFATTAELKSRNFSGWRENQLAQRYELWLTGEIEETISFAVVKLNPTALEEIHKRVFKLD